MDAASQYPRLWNGLVSAAGNVITEQRTTPGGILTDKRPIERQRDEAQLSTLAQAMYWVTGDYNPDHWRLVALREAKARKMDELIGMRQK